MPSPSYKNRLLSAIRERSEADWASSARLCGLLAATAVASLGLVNAVDGPTVLRAILASVVLLGAFAGLLFFKLERRAARAAAGTPGGVDGRPVPRSDGRRLRQLVNRTNMLVVGVVVCCLAGALTVVGLRHGPHRAAPPPSLRAVQAFRWSTADRPNELAASSHGAVWIADEHRAVVSRLLDNGRRRQYPLTDVEEVTDPTGQPGQAILNLVSGPADSAWMFVQPDRGSLLSSDQTVLLGLAPSGKELARYPVPETGSLGIDHDGYAWNAPYFPPAHSGLSVSSIDLHSGTTRTFHAYSGFSLLSPQVRVSPAGAAWVIAAIADGSGHDRGFVVGALTRHGIVARPVRWPRSLVTPSVAATTVDRSGAVWVGYYGGLARIDPDGAVVAYPLFPGTYAGDLRNEPDGRIAFSYVVGPEFGLPPPFQAVRASLYVGELDPRNLRRPPSLQRQPGHGSLWLAVGQRHDAIVDDPGRHTVYRIPLSIARPVTAPRGDYLRAMTQTLDRFRARANAIRDAWARRRPVADGRRSAARASSALIAETTRRLHGLTFDAKEVVDPAITRLVARADADGRDIRNSLVAMARPRRSGSGRSPALHTFIFTYHFLVAQMIADLNELREHLGLGPVGYDGATTWKPERAG